MKYLNSNTLFYLKSANLPDEPSVSLFLGFRQENKYVLRNSHDNQFDYINVLLVLTFENRAIANDALAVIKQLFLDTVLSVEVNSDTEIEFNGDHDYTFKIVSYHENIIDQFKEDWVDRYLYVTREYFYLSKKNNDRGKLIADIKNKIAIHSGKNTDNTAITDLQREVFALISGDFGLDYKEDEFSILKREISSLNEKINLLISYKK